MSDEETREIHPTPPPPPGIPEAPNPMEPSANKNWKLRLQSYVREHLRKVQDKSQNFDTAVIAEWANKTFQKQGASFYGKLATTILCSYFVADITASLVGRFVPDPPVARPVRSATVKRPKSLNDYEGIFARNLFNSKGLIPGEEAPTGADVGGQPTKTTLPFNLIGTLILKDELKSIATIEDKSASIVYPVRSQDEIPSKARIVKIEPRRVIFINTSSGRKEYVELPEEAHSANVRITPGAGKATGPGIEQTSTNSYNVSRTEVDAAFKNLNDLLTQARAVPNIENGVPTGYKLFQIVPGSIYSKLGLKDGDVILGVDGQTINDPGKAFEQLGQLRTATHLSLQIKRDGRPATFDYDIH